MTYGPGGDGSEQFLTWLHDQLEAVGALAAAQARHMIADNGSAQGAFVLRLIRARADADLAIIAEHQPRTALAGWDAEVRVCQTCTPARPYPCTTLRLLAEPFAIEPGWQPSWAAS